MAMLLFGIPVGSAAALPAKPASSAREHGQTIFKARCIVCHAGNSANTPPGGPPDLFKVFGAKPPALTAEQAEQIVLHGKGQMPPFNGVLTKADIQDVIAYLRWQGSRQM